MGEDKVADGGLDGDRNGGHSNRVSEAGDLPVAVADEKGEAVILDGAGGKVLPWREDRGIHIAERCD